MDQFSEELKGFNGGSLITITLNANTADIVAGGSGEAGAIVLKDEQGTEIARIGKFSSPKSSPAIALLLKDAGGQARMTLNASTGDATFGGNGVDGDMRVKNTQGQETLHLSGNGQISAGGFGQAGTLILKNKDGKTLFSLGSTGMLTVGGNGEDGDLYVLPKSTGSLLQATIHLDGDTGKITLKSGDQEKVVIDGSTGKITLDQEKVAIDGSTGEITLQAGGKQRVRIESAEANIWLGGNGSDGDLMLFKKGEKSTNDHTKASIHLNGEDGDIIIGNADCAEEFDLARSECVEPGTVMVLDSNGELQQSKQAFDKRVAGVISGAGDFRPGIVLDKRQSRDHRIPLAMLGKVYCKADAQYGAIEVGDLLTTSPTPGHAMKADDFSRAFGAVIGKALRSLKTGQNLIPILVALQ